MSFDRKAYSKQWEALNKQKRASYYKPEYNNGLLSSQHTNIYKGRNKMIFIDTYNKEGSMVAHYVISNTEPFDITAHIKVQQEQYGEVTVYVKRYE